MTVKEATGPKRLCVWAETPEQRHHIETRLPKYRRSLMPVAYQGQELAAVIGASHMDGIIFYSQNVSLVKLTLNLLENRCPSCSRFVVCTSSDDGPYRSLEGFPPTILREEESPETWADRIERAVLVNQWLTRPEFRMILPRLRTIPSLPESHRRVVEALQDPQYELGKVARIVAQDVGLTAQLLKVVNSAALGLAHPITSISDAIALIGAVRLQSLVMSAWAFAFADEKMCRGFSPAAEWQHALAVAQAAETLARERRAKSALLESAFVAGILHDVGKVMLAANSPGAYADILALANKRDAPLWQTETEVLGYSHAEVGGCLLGLWGLDLTIVEAVSRHHHQDLALSEELSTAKLVFDANLQVCTGGTTPGNRK
ncbi:MAG: HDOD domain-containing protein [Verrucomicrobiota bacterium]|jgi:putative nucleotidyltransferase with HDIG domain